MVKVIAKFNYNHNRYNIEFTENNTIVFYKINNDKQKNNLTSEEIKIVKKIYDNLQVHQESSVFWDNKKIGGNDYDIFYDKSSNNYYWISLSGQYNLEDNKKLNFKYNHEPDIVFVGNSGKIPAIKDMYTKFIKIGKKVVPVLVSASLVLSILSGCKVSLPESVVISNEPVAPNAPAEVIADPTIVTDEVVVTEAPIKEYNYEEIEKCIKDNPNLTADEKELIYMIDFVFDEYHEYMDMESVKYKLSTLSTKYQTETGISNVSSYYNRKLNKIVYGFNNFDETPLIEFFHELLHIFQDGNVPFTGELSNELFAKNIVLRLYLEGKIPKERFLPFEWREDFKQGKLALDTDSDWMYTILSGKGFASGYDSYISMYYILAEILPKEILAIYQFQPYRVDELKKYLVTIDVAHYNEAVQRANYLLNAINDLRDYDAEKGIYIYYTDGVEIFETLNYYYKLQKGKDITDDLGLMSLIYASSQVSLGDVGLFETGISLSYFEKYIFEKNIKFTKIYVMSKLYLWDGQDEISMFWMDSVYGSQTLKMNEELQQEFIDGAKEFDSSNSRN